MTFPSIMAVPSTPLAEPLKELLRRIAFAGVDGVGERGRLMFCAPGPRTQMQLATLEAGGYIHLKAAGMGFDARMKETGYRAIGFEAPADAA